MQPMIESISLDEALSILATMPVSEDASIPEVTTLPVGSRMPFAPYPCFVGREAELRQLAVILKGERGAAVIGQLATTTGWGGIGKTQLASEFVHRYGQYFAGGVFWLDFGRAGGIDNEVARCGGAEGMRLFAGFDNLPLPHQVALVYRAWQEPLPRLLIFDNCEDEALVNQWRPKTGGCRVLITSRRSSWDVAASRSTMKGAIEQVRLDMLTPAESERLLTHLASRLTTEEKTAIAEACGHFPLALHLAGSFLKRYKRVGVNRYLQAIEQKMLLHGSLKGRGSTYSPTKNERHVAVSRSFVRATFALSWQWLDKSDPIGQLAQQLFLHAAYFAPGVPIPPDLLLATLSHGALTLPQAPANQSFSHFLWRIKQEIKELLGFKPEKPRLIAYDYNYTDAQCRLVELGLLEEEPAGFVIHRLLATFAHLQSIHQPQQAVEQALLKEASRLNGAGNSAPLQAWQPHLRHLTDVAQQREDELAASLCHEMGYHLKTVADYKNACLYFERALAIREKVLAKQHPDTAATLNNLGALLYSQGQYKSARPHLERALAIREKVLGEEHPHTATTLNNLGALLYSQGERESARPYYERALAIREKVLGKEHPHTVSSLNNLGQLLRVMGQYESARPYYERALAIYEKELGEEHPFTATNLNNLGVLLDAQGDTARESARPYYERALAIREKVLGEQHPDTAITLNNLGGFLKAQGQHKSARPYLERALAIFEKQLGANHRHTQAVRMNLAELESASPPIS